MIDFPLIVTRPALALVAALSVSLLACAGGKKKQGPPPPPHKTVNLDSLNRDITVKDSIDSDDTYYEQMFKEYSARFPVQRDTWFRVAKGKDREFCLFKPDPAKTCLENGDKFNDLQLKEPARDAYEAGLVSELYNDMHQNVLLWGSIGQLAIENREFEVGRRYFKKILAVEPDNKWAQKQLRSLPLK